MKSFSFISSHELITVAATVAAHSTAQGKDFRQKDVLFFFELFNNWCQSGLFENSNKFQNTQIARYLDQLAKSGYAYKSKSSAKRPSYRLSRIGLLELIYRMTNLTTSNPEHFLFSFYFISNYKQRLMDLIQEEGKQFPPALRIELLSLLDEKSLLDREIKRIQLVKSKLAQRIDDADNVARITETGLRKGQSVSEISIAIQKKYPYELNNQKPLSELISSIPHDQQIWEIGEGAAKRRNQIWSPTLKMLDSYLTNLKAMMAFS